MRHIRTLGLAVTLMIGAVVALPGIAAAHVTVGPKQVAPASFEVFTVSVPNEKSIPTTSIRLEIPGNLEYVSPTQKPGWKIDVKKDGQGEDAKVKSITWSGGTVTEGLRDEFTFSAKVPSNNTVLQWKAYQTYSDGTLVSWDKSHHAGGHSEEGGNSGPFSVTAVREDSAANTASESTMQAISQIKVASDRALAASLIAVVLGLVAVFFATRKK